MRNKVVSPQEAAALIQDGDTVCTSGFVGIGTPDELLCALQQRYQQEQSPKDLTLVFAAGQGDGKERGLNRLGEPGLLKRVIGGHWGLIPRVGKLALDESIEAYNLPQGCISHLYRDIAAGKPGTISRVGLRTFVDPRQSGGKINDATHEDLVELMEIGGEEYLFYKAFPINVAFIRATSADTSGNLTMEREALTLDNLAMAMAVRNSQGVVIAQVERVVERGSLNPRQVVVPGVLVDCVVLAQRENHVQTYATDYSPAFSSEIRVPQGGAKPMPLNPRKIIARRAAMELPINGVVNLGIGMPEGVAAVAQEEGLSDHITLTAEPGVIGGVPAGGLDFGAAVNTDAVVHQNQQFDLYDGGGLDMACLGMAECDAQGNVNVSRFGPRLAGAGGFINISQNARRLVYAGTFTAGGLRVAISEGQLKIEHEGKAPKFVETVEQITFAGPHAFSMGQPVLYVTERCVFELTAEGLELVEVAPGIDVERDILAHMAFTPKVNEPRPMQSCLFRDEPMGLKKKLMEVPLARRISYDAERNLMFLNFEGLTVRTDQEVREIQAAVEEKCASIGHRVDVVVNYDAFEIDPLQKDAYAEMAAHMEKEHYGKVSRYTTSAFTRMRLGGMFDRSVAPHIFRSREEADGSLE